MASVLDKFYRFLMFLACLSMVSAFLTIILGVAAREFGWDIPGLDAYAGYSIAAALFLALPGTLKHGDHIRVTLLLDRVSPRVRNILEWWSLGAGLALTGYMAWYAGRLAWVSYATHDISPGADASPLWIPQISMAVGAIVLFIALLDDLILEIRGKRVAKDDAEMLHNE